MTDAYILEALRSPIGKRKGGLAEVRPDDLAGDCLNGLVNRVDVPPVEVDDVIMGCVTQVDEQGLNVARTAVLAAGWPVSVPGTSVNRMCASSLQAVNFAAQAVMAGTMDLVVGAGVESMSRVNMGADAGSISDRIRDRFDVVGQGVSAELIAERYGFSRTELDELSLESHRRAAVAIDEGYFDREILPIITPGGTVFSQDEGPRRGGSLEKLAGLKTPFRDQGVITAATSSQISDGAAAVLIGSGAKADQLGVKPRARIRSMAVVGTDPTIMLLGPAPATKKALDKAGLTIDDIDVFEVNEAFASVVLAWQRETGASLDKTNVNGGAMALGHPLGCSGARLMVTLLHELERRDATLGLATLCIGWGLAVATVIERV
ncbi:MAG: acetyl-CoA C-acyltransferase [Myxococcales bacterium]|nr:acetyl-CoA C-acyltransferase [Myxococcales bacterium]